MWCPGRRNSQPSLSDPEFRALFKEMPDDEELIESAFMHVSSSRYTIRG